MIGIVNIKAKVLSSEVTSFFLSKKEAAGFAGGVQLCCGIVNRNCRGGYSAKFES